MRKLSQIVSNVGNNVLDTSSSLATIIKNYVNDRYKMLRRRLSLQQFSRVAYQFTTVGGTEDYILPDDFDKELSVLDVTNGSELFRIDTQNWVDKFSTTLNSQLQATNYIILNSPVMVQPTSAGVITVVSSSASDTTGTVRVRGFVSNREDSETINLSGTASSNGTKSFSRIIGITKSTDTVGAVTISRGTDTLAILAPENNLSYYKIMKLVPIPSGSSTIEVNYIPEFLPLSDDEDYPNIDCSDILEAGATADTWRYKRQFAKAQEMESQFEKRLADLAFNYESQPNFPRLMNPKTYSPDLL